MKDTSRQHSERQGKAVYLLFHRGKSDIRRQNYQKNDDKSKTVSKAPKTKC